MKLHDLIAEFDGLEPEEKLELLVEMAGSLPAVSAERGAAPYPESCRVQECQTPVFLWVESSNGAIHLEADVPVKSPTVRGLVALLVEGLEGAAPEDVLTMPDDILGLLGLNETLGMTRQHGMRGLVARLKRDVAALSAGDDGE